MGFDRVAARLKRLSHSIIFKLMALALIMVAVGFVTRFTMLRTLLTEDVVALSAAHQSSIAEYAARDVEDKVRLRLDLLTNLADGLPMAGLAGPQRLNAWLTERHAALPFFSQGLHLIQVADGAVLATSRPDLPLFSIVDSDWFKAVPATGAAHIGKPYRHGEDGKVVLTIAVPVRDQAGAVTAILTGTSAINSPNFLSQLAEKKVGETGGFLLVDPRDGVFIAATDSEQVLKPVPAPGLNPLHDRAMAGFRGTGITTNLKGVEELSAIASVPTPGWFLIARTPTAEALQPVEHIMTLVIRGSIAVSVTVITVLLIMLPRLFRPLTLAARQLHHMARGDQEIRPLPVHSEDEVGEVAKGFNFLLGVLREKEEALRQSEARMSHLAHHDMLTGLPNRAMFEDRLDQALMRAQRQGQGFALLYVDLDGFKPINDSRGHQAGDAMLCHVADCLTGQLRQTDTVARIGGDEFAILLIDLDDPAATAARIAEQCRNAARQPLNWGGAELRVDLSIGIACYPFDGRSAGDLLRHADHAMYKVKGQHKSIA